jgi:hypothetical protein
MASSWKRREAWKEWAPFLVAAILGGILLIAFALTNPIFRGPAPLPESDPSRSQHASASSDPSPSNQPAGAASNQPADAPSDAEPPPP